MKKIIFTLFLQILTTNVMSQDYWLLSSSFAGHFEFFAYSKKNSDLILYGVYSRYSSTDTISILRINRVNDSLSFLESPSSLMPEESSCCTKNVIVKIFDNGLIIKNGELKNMLEAYLLEKRPTVNPLFTVCTKQNKLKKYFEKDLWKYYKVLIKKCREADSTTKK